VANYCNANIPHADGNKREEAIVELIQKWLGKDTFVVKLKEAPKPLRWDQNPHKRNLWPRIPRKRAVSHGLIHRNCFTLWPQLIQFSEALKKHTLKSSWIVVCFLDDLITSHVIHPDFQTKIISAQAVKNAGRPT
jgi:hypothetical protein